MGGCSAGCWLWLPADGMPSPAQHSCQTSTLSPNLHTHTATPLTWSMSPWVADTVWSRSRILSVSQSTCRQGRQEAGRGGGQRVGGELRWLSAAGAAVQSCSSPATPAAPPKQHTRLAAAPPPPAAAAAATRPAAPAHLAAGVCEDDGLGDGQGLVQIAQGVQLPVLALLQGRSR